MVHYLGRHGESRVAAAAIISAVPPLMVKTPANPGGLSKEIFDDFQKQTAYNRAQFYYDVALDRSMVTTGVARNPLRA